MKVTDIVEIKKISEGEIVELPPFLEGEAFIARLRKPSLLGLAAEGIIPNPLLVTAEELFNGRMPDGKKEGGFKESAELFNIIAENALIEPSYEELRKNKVSLTDMQLLAIFNYTQLGVRALEGFRRVKAGNKSDKPK